MEDTELHEHHHEHEHEHHHDHDHEHHPDHDHDHDHEHEHHHDHDHEHHHDHDHDHECHDPNCTDPSHHHHDDECDDPNCTDPSHHHHHHEGPISISHHESSTIGAVKGVIPIADYDEAEKKLAAAMREAGRLVYEAGCVIGHLKFELTGPGRCGQISVTGRPSWPCWRRKSKLSSIPIGSRDAFRAPGFFTFTFYPLFFSRPVV